MNSNIFHIIKEKEMLENSVASLVRGSIEIRTRNNRKYVYVHFREGKKVISSYVGEHSDSLVQTITINNERAKEYKKRIKEIETIAKSFGYEKKPLTDKQRQVIGFMESHFNALIRQNSHVEGIVISEEECQKIIDGKTVDRLSFQDMSFVVSLIDNMRSLMDPSSLSVPSSFELLNEINRFVTRGSVYSGIYSSTVEIETKKIAATPISKKSFKALFDGVLRSDMNDLDKGIECALLISKYQPFKFANERTAWYFLNHYLISHNLNIVGFRQRNIEQFINLRNDYILNDNDEIKTFIKETLLINLVD